MATETDARAARAHPEAELVAAAGGSDGTRVKLCVTNVYNSSSSEVLSLETTNTVGDLKKLIEAAFAGRPPPHQQRLIFRGKQCEEANQLGHILRGVDLAVQHNMHLVVTQPAERTPTGAPDGALPAARHPPPPQQQPPPPSVSGGVAPSVPAVAPGQPERIDLSAEQMGELQWQYQQAMRENQQALQQHQQNHHFLSSQSMALTQQQQQQPQQQQPRQYYSEVATAAATRALGGNMPGPAAGGAVRDVTGAPPAQFIPAAGLGEDGEAGRGNLVDPPRRAPDLGREARGLVKMVLQCMVIFLVFGIDADGLMLVLLGVAGLVTVLFKTGFLKEVLGGRQSGGGLWKKLCSAATVIAEGGGVLMDARFLATSFVLSIFPKWKPVRSPEAIAAEAEAAAQAAAEAEAAAQAAAEAARVAEAETEAVMAAAIERAQQATAEREAAEQEAEALEEVEGLEVD